jgi:signal transduction histidine kinase
VVRDQKDRAGALLEAELVLSSERSLPAILDRIVQLATRLVSARYGALGVLGPDGHTISQLVTAGISPKRHEAIGRLPSCEGILGEVLRAAGPVRIANLRDDPRAVGVPTNHPRMRSFLGVPVSARGRLFGAIYLAEKRGATEFDANDESVLTALAAQAGVALENAHLDEELRDRVQRLDALYEIGAATVRGDPPNAVIQLVARHARALLHADLAGIAVPTKDRRYLVVQTVDGTGAETMLGERCPLEGSVSGDVILRGRVKLLEDAAADRRVAQPLVHSGRFGPAMFVPLAARGEPFGTLLLARRRGSAPFGEGQVRIAETFASQAAVVLEDARLRREVLRLEKLEDRERIDRELHDGTIQSLFTVGLGLQATSSLVSEPGAVRRIDEAVQELDRVIRDLRNYIFGLTPSDLAERQLSQALQKLVGDFQERTGMVAVADIEPKAAAALALHAAEVLQITREALSNVRRHAHAATCRVSLHRDERGATLEVDDDGDGFDVAAARGSGHGLANLRARAARAGGSAEIASIPGQGTTVRVKVPLAGAVLPDARE